MCSFRMTSGTSTTNQQFDPVAKGKRKIDDPGSESESESTSEFVRRNDKGKKLLEGEGEGEPECEGTNVISKEHGYETPTSPENRIPAVTECPPAPRKPRPSRLKRKRSSASPPPRARRCLELDALEEVLFRPASDGGGGVFETTTSKSPRRRDDEEDGVDDNDKDRS